jgi:hypothetical protein
MTAGLAPLMVMTGGVSVASVEEAKFCVTDSGVLVEDDWLD